MLRITKDRRVSYISTKVHVEPKYWNEDKQQVRKTHPESSYLNHYLRMFLSDAQKYGHANHRNVKDLKNVITGKSGTTFTTYAQSIIDSVRGKGEYWNAKNIKTALTKFTVFMGTRDILFRDISEITIREFENYLIEKGNRKNTRAKNLGSLKRIFSSAVKERVIRADDNPFMRFTISKERVEKQKLTLDELQALISAEVPDGTGQWHAKNYWLFSFFCGGVRFSDICILRWKHVQDGRINYKMQKTGTGKNIAMVPQAKSILDLYRSDEKGYNDYVFPILKKEYSDQNKLKEAISARNALVNKDLKKVAKTAGIDVPLSMHLARHTYAVIALASGMDIYSLSRSLGHSDIKITESYLKSFDEKVDNEVSKMFKKLKKL